MCLLLLGCGPRYHDISVARHCSTAALQYQDGGKFYNCTRGENLDLILLPEIDINWQVIIVKADLLCIISVLDLCDNIK